MGKINPFSILTQALIRAAFSFGLCCVSLLFGTRAHAQVSLYLKDETGKGIPGANLTIDKDGHLLLRSISDREGRVVLALDTGRYRIYIACRNYENRLLDVVLASSKKTMEVQLSKSAEALDQVDIVGNKLDGASAVRSSAYAPEVTELSGLSGTSRSLVEVVNQTPGLRVRQQGGMGSAVDIMLNGIDGKDVQLFLDGVPVYLLGRGYELQHLSVGMLERIEAYKGLVPIQFGADALGGVINMVTRKQEKSFLDLGFSYGSWQTAEATIAAYGPLKKNGKLAVGLDLVYRRSKNNYWMDQVDVVVDEFYNTRKGRARRFNDAYEFLAFRPQLRVRDLGWAGSIQLISSLTLQRREWQHGLLALMPWGEPFSREFSAGSAVNWKMGGRKLRNWEMDLTIGGNLEKTHFIDTSSRAYFWDGVYVERPIKGESGLYSEGRTPEVLQQVWYARENGFFRLNENLRLNVNLLSSGRRLTGQDRAGTVTYKTDPFKTPQSMFNNFFGVSLESRLMEGKLLGTTAVKHYYNRVHGIGFKVNNEVEEMVSSNSSGIGFGQVFKWMPVAGLSILPGYEYAIRQPDHREIFGDYISIRPNPNLVPARSHNLNLKLDYGHAGKGLSTVLSGFYRNSKNRIILTSLTNAFAAYTNLLRTSVVGAEWAIRYRTGKAVDLMFNATYQDIRLRGVDRLGILSPDYVGARVPNIPYLFGNAQVAYLISTGREPRYKLRATGNLAYVHEYFLTWGMNGVKSSKALVPSQLSADISLLVKPESGRWSFGIDGKNLSGAKLYDNFSVQRPGRSFYGKITYLFTNRK